MENNKSITSILESIGELFNDLTVAADELIEKHKEEKPVAGWYKDTDWPKFMSYRVDGKFIYGWGTTGIWLSDMKGIESSPCREYLADPNEVEQRLIEEAKRRGFKEGVKVKYPSTDEHVLAGEFHLSNNQLCAKGRWVFSRGEWAEIIPEPLTLNGKEVYFDDKYVWIGNEFLRKCNTVMHRRQLEVYAENAHIKSITFNQDETYSFKDLKQLLTKIEENENR